MIAALLKFFPVVFRQLSMLLGIPYVLKQSAGMIILLPSAANISSTGAITGISSSLPSTPVGVVQVYMYARTGLAAGLYYARFSNTSTCQLYTDAAGTITPTGISSGAYTPSTGGAITLASITIPGGAMGANGCVRGEVQFSQNNSSGTRLCVVTYAANTIISVGQSTVPSALVAFTVRNRGVSNLQQCNPLNTYGGPGTVASNFPVVTQVNSNQDQTLIIKGVVNTNTTDYIAIEGYTIEILPRN